MDIFLEVAKTVFALLWPPLDGASPKEKRWRLSVAGGIMFMAGALTSHILLACGFLPVLFAGFANADDVSALKVQAEAARADTLRSQILVAVKDQCLARQQHNNAAENYATARKYAIIDEMKHLNESVDIPACWEVPNSQ